MRCQDRDNYPCAHKRGTYGCLHCGNYARLQIGAKLKCSLCRCVTPMVPVAVVDDPPENGTQGRLESSQEMDTY